MRFPDRSCPKNPSANYDTSSVKKQSWSVENNGDSSRISHRSQNRGSGAGLSRSGELWQHEYVRFSMT
jgi:hypothetical protein